MLPHEVPAEARCRLTVSVWIGLLLGVITTFWRVSDEITASERLATATQPSASRPSTSHPAPSPLTAEELDEHVRLITDNNTPEARTLGARKLLRTGSAEAMRRLVDILESSPDLAAKQAVCRAIANGNTPPRGKGQDRAPATSHLSLIIEPLIALLGDHPEALDELIVSALRRFDLQSFIPRLLTIAKNSSLDVSKRKAAVTALGSIGDEHQAIGALMALLQEDGVLLRAVVLETLARATGVQHENANAALVWWESHRTMTQLQWLREVNARRTEERDRLRVEKAVLTNRLVTAYREAYLQTPEPQRPEKLLAFLGDEAAAVRGMGLDLINALITDRKEVGQPIKARLIDMISDSDTGLRRKVAAMVGDLRPVGAGARLKEAVVGEGDFRVRAAQVSAFGRLDEASAIPVVIVCLDDEASEVVMEAALALGTLARQGHALEPQIVDTVVSALVERYQGISVKHEDLRVRFLEAMGRIGHERFASVFRTEMEPGRSVRVRSTAITGMASLRQTARSAGEVRGFITAPEPEVREAVAQALGRCGRYPEDLNALAERLDSSQETIPAVRERAWESYQSILQRSPASAQFQQGVLFVKSEDPTDRRRGIALLKALKSDQSRFDQLSLQDRVDLLAYNARAQFTLNDYQAASKNYEQALSLAENPKSEQSRILSLELAATFFRLNQDEKAILQLKAIPIEKTQSGVNFCIAAHDVLFQEAGRRLADAEDASQFSAVLEMIESAELLFHEHLPDPNRQRVAELLNGLREKALAKREARVESLLGAIAADTDANLKLLGFGGKIVLPQVYNRLKQLSATTGSATGDEAKLIDLARKLAPDWAGYVPGCPPEERAKALEQLKSAKIKAKKVTSTMPASAPA